MKDYRVFASPFKRLLAFCIDLIILAIFGYLTSFLFEDLYIVIGEFGKLLGFSLAGLYFTLLEINFNGQSIGKKVLRIKVVDIDNKELTNSRAILRYSIWGICYFANGISFSGSDYETLLASIGTIIFFGLGFILIFLFIFNRKTKQSLHDIVFNTYVINIKYENPIEKQRINRALLPVSIAIPTVAFISLFFFNMNNINTKITNLESYRVAIIELPEINNAGVSTGKTTFKSVNGNSRTTNYLQIKTFLEDNFENKTDIAIRIADLIITKYPEEQTKDLISVSVAFGYDIGIWSRSNSFSMKLTPEAWITKIAELKQNNDI